MSTHPLELCADPLAFVRWAEARRCVLVELYGLDDPDDRDEKPDGKRPRGADWKNKGKLASVGRVTTWLGRGSNVGLLPGPSGVAVLDVEASGVTAWPRSRIPAGCLLWSTPSGGFHAPLDLTAVERVLGCKLTGKLTAPGAELISHGGQVVIPPSRARSRKALDSKTGRFDLVREGGYVLEQMGEPIADEALIRELLAPFEEAAMEKARADARPAGQVAPSDTTTRRGRKVLDAELRTISEHGATAGTGRWPLFIKRASRVYSYVAGGEIAEAEAKECLRDMFEATQPERVADMERALADVRRYGFDKPCKPRRSTPEVTIELVTRSRSAPSKKAAALKASTSAPEQAIAPTPELTPAPTSESKTGHSEVSANGHGGLRDSTGAPFVQPVTIERGALPAAPHEDDETDEIESLNKTDLGNGERLARRYGQDMRHCSALGGWLIYDGKHWARDETGEADRRAKATARSIFAEAAPLVAKIAALNKKLTANIARINDDDRDSADRKKLADEVDELEAKKGAIYSHAFRSEAEPRVRAMLSRGAVEEGIAVRARDFDADPWLFNCENGTLNLRTLELRPHRRDDMITKLAPVRFVPGARCEAWDAFLASSTAGEADRVGYLRRLAGYLLTGDTSEDAVAMIDGPGGSGKSTFAEALKAMLGDYAATISFETLLEGSRGASGNGPRPEIAKIAGARLVVATEVEAGRSFNVGLLKALSGGDTISARMCYRDPFEFRSQAKLLLVANELPHVSRDDSAAWRRIKRVKFPHAVAAKKRDTKLRARLQEPDARAAILAWAFEGLREWLRDGLGTPPVVEQETAELRERGPTKGLEVARVFVAEQCDTTDPRAWTSNATLYGAAGMWAEARGVEIVSRESFGRALEALGYGGEQVREAGEKVRGRRGLRLRALDATEATP